MTEEKKEPQAEKKNEEAAQPKPEVKPEAPAQPAQPAAPVQAEAQPAAPAAAAAPVKEEKKAEAPKKVKPENCASCNKSVRKKRWYYRNGKFYCTKRCWQTALKKDAKAAETAGAEKK